MAHREINDQREVGNRQPIRIEEKMADLGKVRRGETFCKFGTHGETMGISESKFEYV